MSDDASNNGHSAVSAIRDLLAKGAPEAERVILGDLAGERLHTLVEEVTHVRIGRTAVLDISSDARLADLEVVGLGWTQREIGTRLDVAKGSVPTIGELADSGRQVRDLLAKGVPEAEVATRFNMPDQLVAAAGDAKSSESGRSGIRGPARPSRSVTRSDHRC